jgi:hypothetical protein
MVSRPDPQTQASVCGERGPALYSPPRRPAAPLCRAREHDVPRFPSSLPRFDASDTSTGFLRHRNEGNCSLNPVSRFSDVSSATLVVHRKTFIATLSGRRHRGRTDVPSQKHRSAPLGSRAAVRPPSGANCTAEVGQWLCRLSVSCLNNVWRAFHAVDAVGSVRATAMPSLVQPACDDGVKSGDHSSSCRCLVFCLDV